MTATVPMGFRVDPDLSPIENAKAAWEKQADLQRRDGTRQIGDLLRRVLKIDPAEIEIEFLGTDQVAAVAIDDELIALHNGALALVEACSSCGQQWKFWGFNSLSGLGRQIAESNRSDDFECESCRWRSLSKKGRR